MNTLAHIGKNGDDNSPAVSTSKIALDFNI
jgi:hypothetical protein